MTTNRDSLLAKLYLLCHAQVKRLIPGGVADCDGRIEKGDCILSVNSHNLSGLTKKEAAEVLKEARGSVVLVMHRLEDNQRTPSSEEVALLPKGELPTTDTEEEKVGAESTGKRIYSNIFSWVGRKVERFGKLMGETTASLSPLRAFGGSKKPSSPKNSKKFGNNSNSTCSHLHLEDECITSPENSEPNLALQENPAPYKKLEEEEQNQSSSKTSYTEVYNQSSSKTSYTEVYTSDGDPEEFRVPLNRWPVGYRSLLNLNQGFAMPLLPNKKTFDFHIMGGSGSMIHDVSTSSMIAEISASSSKEEHLSTPSSEGKNETLHAEQPTLKDTLQSLIGYSSEHYHLKRSQGFSAGGETHNKHTDSSSESDSMPIFTDYGHGKKMHVPLPWSARHYHYPRSSEDLTRNDVFVTPPYMGSKKRPYNSVNPQREVLTFRDYKSTLPRRISGSRDNLRLVELRKGTGWLGLQLKGGVHPNHMTEPLPITVGSLIKGGAAYRSGQMHEGDEIIEVNGIPMADLTLREAVDIVRQQPPGNVIFLLRESQYDHNYSCRKRLF